MVGREKEPPTPLNLEWFTMGSEVQQPLCTGLTWTQRIPMAWNRHDLMMTIHREQLVSNSDVARVMVTWGMRAHCLWDAHTAGAPKAPPETTTVALEVPVRLPASLNDAPCAWEKQLHSIVVQFTAPTLTTIAMKAVSLSGWVDTTAIRDSRMLARLHCLTGPPLCAIMHPPAFREGMRVVRQLGAELERQPGTEATLRGLTTHCDITPIADGSCVMTVLAMISEGDACSSFELALCHAQHGWRTWFFESFVDAWLVDAAASNTLLPTTLAQLELEADGDGDGESIRLCCRKFSKTQPLFTWGSAGGMALGVRVRCRKLPPVTELAPIVMQTTSVVHTFSPGIRKLARTNPMVYTDMGAGAALLQLDQSRKLIRDQMCASPPSP